MAMLTVWRYDTVAGAGQAGELLRELAREDALVGHDAATVEWEVGRGKPRTQQVPPETTAAGALDPGFWGLLFGLIFFLPLLGAAIGAATGALTNTLADIGIDDCFINRVRDTVTPGTSALFVLSSENALERVRDALAQDPQGELIFTHLTDEQEAALREVFTD